MQSIVLDILWDKTALECQSMTAAKETMPPPILM